MSIERELATFVVRTRREDVPPEAERVVRNILMTTLGTAIAGAHP